MPPAKISEGWTAELREHFLGIHFFNPPRYLHLVEIILGAETRPDIVAFVSDFCDRHLGKGVVPCKDTPNFIANRIGAFFGSTVQRLTVEHDLTIEETDAPILPPV
ncbi:MAG TPA: 3-hydroxyacyl-CoA dehydrogenase NAD-binding domain-containing protein [Bryobacteraceae bacterium]